MGDKLSDVALGIFHDADFGGCQAAATSTSVCFFCITGEKTRFGLAAASEAQSVASHSTPEAVLGSADLQRAFLDNRRWIYGSQLLKTKP